jgi:signal transduction histidine kinase
MELDIRTLSFALGLTFFIQAIALYFLSLVIMKVSGLKLWAWGSIVLTLGFLAIFFRSFQSFENGCILLGNAFHFGGFVLLYIGSKRFLGLEGNNRVLVAFSILFLLSIFFFTFLDNNLKARISVYSFSISILLFLNGWIFIRNNQESYRKSAIFLATIFFTLCLFFMIRLFYTLSAYDADNFFTPEIMQTATFIFSMSIGLLWTFGLIIIVTQKMNNELAITGKQLEILNDQKDKFFSILAHDLRGPFASMINLSEVLSEESGHLSGEQKNVLAASLNKTAQSTNELLEDLLEWSGIVRGAKLFHPCEMTFVNMMSHTLSALESAASNKQIKLVNEIPENTLIFADPYMFQAIFRNLLINSIKFTPEKGKVILRSEPDNGSHQVFSVADNGIGMNTELLASLFRIDVKSNRPGTNGEISSGLGLLLCKEFVEKHEGNIWVESQERLGSKFFFSIKKKM